MKVSLSFLATGRRLNMEQQPEQQGKKLINNARDDFASFFFMYDIASNAFIFVRCCVFSCFDTPQTQTPVQIGCGQRHPG